MMQQRIATIDGKRTVITGVRSAPAGGDVLAAVRRQLITVIARKRAVCIRTAQSPSSRAVHGVQAAMPNEQTATVNTV